MPLKEALDAPKRRSALSLVNLDGKPWTPDGFHASWARARGKAEIIGLAFNDLPGTAVTRLALAGRTEPEISTLTGHSLRDVRSILDAHHFRRDPRLAENAIREQKLPTERPTATSCQSEEWRKRNKING